MKKILLTLVLLPSLCLAQIEETVKITYYHAKHNSKTADGSLCKNIINKSCALSRDLLRKYPYGSIIIYNGNRYTVHDKTGPKARNTVDILIDKNRKIKTTKTKVTIIRK